MAQEREETKGTLPCMVCGQEVGFLHPYHMEAKHSDGEPQDLEEYKEWVADRFELDPDDPVFESGGLTIPGRWKKHRHKFDGW